MYVKQIEKENTEPDRKHNLHLLKICSIQEGRARLLTESRLYNVRQSYTGCGGDGVSEIEGTSAKPPNQ